MESSVGISDFSFTDDVLSICMVYIYLAWCTSSERCLPCGVLGILKALDEICQSVVLGGAGGSTGGEVNGL